MKSGVQKIDKFRFEFYEKAVDVLDRYESKLNSPDKFQCRHPMPNFVQVPPVLSDKRTLFPIMLSFRTCHKLNAQL